MIHKLNIFFIQNPFDTKNSIFNLINYLSKSIKNVEKVFLINIT